jgi:hypothetical protein
MDEHMDHTNSREVLSLLPLELMGRCLLSEVGVDSWLTLFDTVLVWHGRRSTVGIEEV